MGQLSDSLDPFRSTPAQVFRSFFAVVGGGERADELLKTGLSYLPRYRRQCVVHEAEGLKLGVFSPEGNPLDREYLVRVGDFVIYLEGDFYEIPGEITVRNLLLGQPSDSTLFAFLNGLNGIFRGFLVDLGRGNCTAFVNWIGFTLLYYCLINDAICVSSSIWPLIRMRWQAGADIDRSALEDMVLLGHPASGRTILSQVSVLQPGNVVNVSRTRSHVQRYFTPPARTESDPQHAARRMRCAWHDHIQSIAGGFDPNRIATTLTGGRDTRVVLNALISQGIRPTCLHVGSSSRPADEVRARRVAKAAGCSYRLVTSSRPPDEFDHDNYVLGEGIYASGNWTFGALSLCARQYGDVVEYGHTGDVLGGFCDIGEVDRLGQGDTETLVRWSLSRYYAHQTPPQYILKELFGASLNDFLARYVATFDELGASDPYTTYVWQRLGNRDFRRLAHFASAAKLGVPAVCLYHDRRVADVYLTLCRNLWLNQRLHCSLGHTAIPRLRWLPAFSYPLPPILEPFVPGSVRTTLRSLTRTMQTLKQPAAAARDRDLEFARDVIQLAREEGILDPAAIARVAAANPRTAHQLLYWLLATLKLIRFARGTPLPEIDGSRLFGRAQDMTRVDIVDTPGCPLRSIQSAMTVGVVTKSVGGE